MIAVILASASVVGGCGAPQPGAPPTSPPEGTESSGAFAPVRLRVHPLTRWTRDAERDVVIRAHVELLDAWEHPVKELGVFRVELRRVRETVGSSESVAGEPELRWEVDLRDPQQNAGVFYDGVTQTYELTLGVDRDVSRSAAWRVEVVFTDPSGRRLSDSFRLEPLEESANGEGS